MGYIEIDGRRIGQDYEPLIIPEIGINHNGDLAIAKAMVDAAYRAGAEVIKHQTHVVDDEMSSAAREVIPGNADISIYDIMARCALTEDEEYELKAYTEVKGLLFLSTPFSRAAANRLERMNVKAYKIGSGEMNNYPLLDHVASFGKPMIVSTGMNDIHSVRKAVSIMEARGVPYALMHTTNLYPTPFHLVRLGAMQQLITEFPSAVVGLSDHTVNNNAALAAIALGASLVERHFTDVMERSGPDIVCSMDESVLKDLIRSSREIFQMRGGEKGYLPEEQVTMDFAFATAVAIKEIRAGELLTEENIWVKRPGTGEIPAEQYKSLLGRCVKEDIPKDSHLKWSMIS